jgi:ADP-ribose pyrophosphatase
MTPFDQHDVDIQHEETVYEGFFQVKRYQLRHKRFAGDWTESLTRELFIRGQVAAVLPYDPLRDEVVLIEQFRLGALAQSSPWLLEIVAGIQEPGESTEALARRECQEEAGLSVQKLIKMLDYWVSPGGCNEYLSLFCGIVDSEHADGIHGLQSEHEDIRVLKVSSTKAYELVQNGAINNAATIIAIQWLILNKEKLR